jgi:DNA-binding MarR family transcriptional regulator
MAARTKVHTIIDGDIDPWMTQLLALLEPFLKLRGTIPARAVQAFVLVAQKEGRTVGELAKLAGCAQSTMSRNLLDLGDHDRRMEPGAGLVVGKVSVENRRERVYSLSRQGRKLLEKLRERAQ